MKVLFVGNSYTYYNDMPEMFAALARENGRDVSVDSVTKGGRKLYQNLESGDKYHEQIASLCAQNQYDVLMLQEQSYLPLVDYDAFWKGLSGVNAMVCAKRTVLYATWGRKAGCDLLETLNLTSEEMTEQLADLYARAAKDLGAELSPVGKAFSAVGEIDPEMELYNQDLSHPSREGSALAALVHYVTVFGEVPKTCLSLQLDARASACFLQAIS